MRSAACTRSTRSCSSAAAGLLVRDGRAGATRSRRSPRETAPTPCYFTTDVSPYARRRDQRVVEALGAAARRPQPGNYIADVDRIATRNGDPYTVFSAVPPRLARAAAARDPPRAAARCSAPTGARQGPPAPPGTRRRQRRRARTRAPRAKRFLRRAGDRYDDAPRRARRRHLAAQPASALGRRSARCALEHRAAARRPDAFVRQLAWRDFYAHVLLHGIGDPRARRDPEWEDDPGDARLRAWQEGRTGYPLVDAGMRQLRADRLDAQPRPPGRRLAS